MIAAHLRLLCWPDRTPCALTGAPAPRDRAQIVQQPPRSTHTNCSPTELSQLGNYLWIPSTSSCFGNERLNMPCASGILNRPRGKL